MKIYTTMVVEEGEDLVFNVPDQILENLQLELQVPAAFGLTSNKIVSLRTVRNSTCSDSCISL